MIAIIGGGIAGLSAAYELSTRRVPFTLFEGSPRLGGLVRTEHVAGFTIEAGADSMLAQKRAAVDLCSELGLEPRLISPNAPRTAFVLHRGALHSLPAPSMLGIPATWTGLASYSLLPPLSRARIALEPLLPVRRQRSDESIASFFRR
nr:FAD-dependent oxidoreductase [Acidobacteriota bacterium]